jgi:hypothetical protein
MLWLALVLLVRQYSANGVAIALLLLSVVVCLLYINAFAVDVPFLDDWDFIPWLQKMYNHDLSWKELVRHQHNEHRVGIPFAIMLVISWLTHYNLVALMYFGAGCLIVIAFVLCLMVWQRSKKASIAFYAMIPIAWLILSLRQSENLLWGFQSQIILAIGFYVLTVYFIDTATGINWRFWLAIISALFDTYSFANGVLVWPIGFLQLLVNAILNKINNKEKTSFLPVLVWFGIGLFALFRYFRHYHVPTYDNSFFLQHCIKTDPAYLVQFFLACLGSPLSDNLPYATAYGAILLCFTIWTLVLIIRGSIKFKQSLIAPLALLLFGFLSALAIVIGRSKSGMWIATVSRYTTINNIGIVGLYLLMITAAYKQHWVKPIGISFLTLLIMINVLGIDIKSCDYKSNMYLKTDRALMSDEVRNYKLQSKESLSKIYPKPEIIFERAPFLEQERLSLFARSGI